MITNTTYRFLVEKLGDSDPTKFVGNEGEVFYDPTNPVLKLSNGSTPGGVSVGGGEGGGGGFDEETDPIFSASVAFGITSTDTSNWDTAYGWGDHSTAGYLTSFDEEESYWVQTSAGIHTLSNVGIGTTNPTSALTVGGDVSISGVVTATTFVGDIETASLRTSELGIVLGGNSEVDVYGVSIGYNSQSDTYGVSVGAFSGTKHVTNNTAYTVAIGAFAQQNANPGDSTGIGAVAIGNLAGDSKQGSDAIALGRYAGRNNQASNSIVINATGSDLNNTTSSSFVVKPIRNVTGSNILTYNSTSGEITHTTSVNINKLTFPDTTEQTTAYAATSTSYAQTLIVDPNGSDVTGNGGPNAPFKTLQAAHDYAASNNSASEQVIVKLNGGSYAGNLLVTRPNTHFVGPTYGQSKSTRISGIVTVATTSSVNGFANDMVTFENMLIVTNSGNSVVTIGGTIGCSVVLKDVYVFTTSTDAKCIDVTNTATSGINFEIKNVLLQNSQSSGTTLDISNTRYADIDLLKMYGGSGTSMQLTKTNAVVYNARFENTGVTTAINVLSSFAPGQTTLVLGNSTIANPSANGNGIDIAANSITNVGQVSFNVGSVTGTGFAVKGVAGSVFVNGNNLIVPGTNNKVSTAIGAGNIPLGTSLTPA